MFFEYLWCVEKKIISIKCFFIGHIEKMGNKYNYEDDWCDRCFCNCPEDKLTMPRILQKIYARIVSREWNWFDKFDWWLSNNFGKHLPSWWEY